MSAPSNAPAGQIVTPKQLSYLVLFDGSVHSHRTIDYMKKFGLKGSKIILYAAFPQGPVGVPGVVDWASIERDTKKNDMTRVLQKAKDELVAAGDLFRPDDISFCIVESDDIRDAVLDFAFEENIDTIVVGTRGHGAVKRAFLGSVSTYLVENATTTVVICRDSK